MSGFQEKDHPRETSGRFTHKEHQASTATLGEPPRKPPNWKDIVGFSNKKVIAEASVVGMFKINLAGRTEHQGEWLYNSRTRTAQHQDGTILSGPKAANLILDMKRQNNSPMGTERIMDNLEELTFTSAEAKARMPKGATMLRPPVYGQDENGQPIETVSYALRGRQSVVTAGDNGAIEISRRVQGGYGSAVAIVHSKKPFEHTDSDPRECIHTGANKCHTDVWNLDEEDFDLFENPEATLASSYNDFLKD